MSALSGGGVTIGGSGSGALTLTGTLASLNAYLDTASNIQYLHSTANLNGDNADTIAVTVNDNGNTGTGGGGDIALGTVNVDITAVNDAPVLDLNGSDGGGIHYSVPFVEGDPAVNVVDSDATIVDVDNTTYNSLTITIAGNTSGDKEEVNIAGLKFKAGNSKFSMVVVGSTNFRIDFNGTLFTITENGGGVILGADLQTLIRGITYENIDNDPTIGVRTFDFVAKDSDGLSSTLANSSINGSSVNDAPVISGGPGVSGLTESDTGLTDSGTLTVTDEDTTDIVTAAVDSLAISGTGSGSVPGSLTSTILEGFLSVSPTAILDGTETTNTLTWNFNSGSEAFDFLAAGETLILSYTVSATDDDGVSLSDTETVTVTITGSNDAPVITVAGGDSDAETLTETDTTLTSSGTLTVSDSDLTDVVTSSVSSVVAGGTTTGLQSNNAALLAMLSSTPTVVDGTELSNTLTWDFNSASEAFDYLGDGESLTLTYTVTVTDSQSATDTQLVTITIAGSNDAPTLTDSFTVNLAGTNEDSPSTGSLVSSIFAGAGGDDVDSGSQSGIAVTTTTGNGTWQYSTDGNNWTDFGAVAANSALLLTSTTQVRYSPDSIDGETATFDFIGWDQTVSSGSSIGSPSLVDPTGKTGDTNEFSTETATAAMVVTAVNDAVIAVADTGSATEAGGVGNATSGNSATGNVLSNDVEVDPGDTLNVTGVAAGTVASANSNVATSVSGTYGAITIAADGSYTYVVDEDNAIVQALRTGGDSVNDTFTYTVTDSGGATSPTQIVVTIDGQNDAPTAVADNATAVEAGGAGNADAGTNPTGNVLTNDTDVDAGDTKTVTGNVVGATTGAVGTSVAGAYGAITINANGSYSYIVDNNNAAVEALRTSGDTLDDVFTYTMTDADGATSSTQITVTIEGQNDDPVAIDDNLTAVESGGVSNATAGSNGAGNVLANDTDKDAADSQTIIGVVSGSQLVASGNVGTAVTGTYGNLTIDAAGNATFVVDENNAAVQALRTVADTLSEVFTYTMTDTGGADATAEVTITITGQNDAPVAVANAATAIEASGIHNNISGTNPSGNVLTNDTDVDSGDTKTVVGVDTGIQSSTTGNVGGVVTGTYGEIVVNSDGSYTYTLDNDNAAVEALLTGQSLSETFSYTMQDTAGLQSTTQINITIDGRTDLPVAEADMDTALEAGGLHNASAGIDPSGNVLANDSSNNGKTVVGVDAGITLLATGDVGTEVVGTYGSVVIDANGDFTYSLDNDNPAVEALRTTGEHVTDIFSYTMEDADGNSSTTQLTITVDGNNDVIIAVADIDTAVESGGWNNSSTGSDAIGNLLANDIDVDAGDTKTVVGVQLGTQASTSGSVGASVAGNYGSIVINNDGSYTYSINESLAAVQALRTTSDTLLETYSYTVADTAGSTSTTQIVITIQGSNDAPTAVVDAATAYEAGGVANTTAGTNPTGNVLSNDTDVDAGDTKTIVGVAAGTTSSAAGNVSSVVAGTYGSITIASDGGYTYVVDNDNATVQALRTSGQSVTDTFTYTFEDTDGLSATTQISVAVRGANDAIVATADTMMATEAGGTANARQTHTIAREFPVLSRGSPGSKQRLVASSQRCTCRLAASACSDRSVSATPYCSLRFARGLDFHPRGMSHPGTNEAYSRSPSDLVRSEQTS